MFITKRKLGLLIQSTLKDELKSIGESFKREQVYVSDDRLLRFITRYMSQNLESDISSIVGKESYLDRIIERIQRKQL
jgi:hypothetical protein